MIVASAFLAGIPTGISVAAAILLHEIPHELGDFGILVHSGYSTRGALKANLMIGLMATVGAALTYFFVEMVPTIQQILIPVTAGGFLYVSLADLVPQLHEQTAAKQTLQQIVLFATGFLISLALKNFAH
jgi:zinc and cadmium transporter